MDFFSLIIFLIIYYIRPQEWIPLVKPLKPVTLAMVFALFAMMNRHRGLTIRDLFKTPHDWVVLIYCLWMVVASPTPVQEFFSVYTYYLFYVVTVQALSSVERIRVFLVWWSVMIFGLAMMAVLSQYGFDLTGSYDLTVNKMKGRLAFNTSIFDNPNALGHSIVPCLAMMYFLFIWKRPIFVRIGSVPLFAVPIFCIYLTLSKGAFLSAFATLVAGLSFGRHKITQLVIIGVALTSGWAAVQLLPRMEEVENSKSDEAIQGRVAAFKFGYYKLSTQLFGVGKGRFVPAMQRETDIYKASHSSYVEIGCELGRPGLFLFLGLLYCCLRTLVTSRTRDEPEERIRRILFSMVISYAVSSWMVDFAYRTTYFMFTAAIAAFHRLMLEVPNVARSEDEETVQDSLKSLPAYGPRTAGAAPLAIDSSTISETVISVPTGPSFGKEPEPEPVLPGITWNRIGLIDVILMTLLTFGAMRLWHYVMNKM